MSPSRPARPVDASRTGVGRPDDASLRAVLDGLDDAVHLYDRSWRWMYLNPAAADWVRRLGHDPEDLLGRRMWDVFVLDADVREAAERAASAGVETVVEVPVPQLDHAWYETRIVPVRGGVVSFSRDVTVRRRAQEHQRVLAEASAALSASLDPDGTLETLTRTAVERIADYAIAYVVDEAAGVLRRVGAAARRDQDILRRLLGASIRLDSDHAVAEVVRSGRTQLTARIDDETLRRSVRDAEHLGILQRMEPRSSIIVPLRARGHTLGAVAVATVEGGARPYDEADATLVEELGARAALAFDNARLFDEARGASRAKSQFLATISHELRTPLTAILGYADIIDAGLSGPLTEPQRKQVRRIMMSARHLVGVIDQILSFSRAEAGREEVLLDTVDLAELLEETAALLEPQAFEKGLRIERRTDGRPTVHSDGGKVRQILLNLGGNAVKFTEKGRVELELAEADGHVLVHVRDTGPGIDPAETERIFEPFTQVHGSTTRAHGGAGLGLAVCRRLARLLGGDVTVDSEPGSGSTFTLRLPA